MLQEDKLREALEKVRDFFESEEKGDCGYYRIYSAKYADSTVGKTELRGSNFKTQSIDESIEKLEGDLRSKGRYSGKFFHIKHYTGKTDPSPVFTVIENPFFDPNAHKQYGSSQSGINGIGANDMILGLLQSHSNETINLREKIKDLEHQREMDRMEDRISQLESGQRNVLDTLLDFVQSDTGQQIAGGIFGLLQTKLTIPQNNVVNQHEQPKNDFEQPKPEPQSDAQNNAANLVSQSLHNLDQVFGTGEGLNALYELSVFCMNNPDKAKMLRNINRTSND